MADKARWLFILMSTDECQQLCGIAIGTQGDKEAPDTSFRGAMESKHNCIYVIYEAKSQIAQILLCKPASLQQVRHDKSARLKQVIVNDEVTTRRTCSKLVESSSLPTIVKTEYKHKPQIRTSDNPLPKPVALATQPAGPQWTLCTVWVREYKKTAVEE
ncbi:hypothetical protein AVEN_159830-1 [Araneus ventricosus]|uniref:Uncharacterized protein n=1 Tax=Araneus ventricosus TaxID=182803 RepID=A0A4Y2RSU4_ARAVE|nr:hypothetical protein AVEN_155178-1 [Araneus ventricosus]GBN78331.1 hypothetical protein AVEN_159830-1 [Araneus ventricosus]